ncbi:MAG: radical SAM family heme chaperone HemW [Chloroflexota bacterium]|nr:radical SAM family heme chaperone HemW [Chloroflexota bacterium]
MIQLTDTPTRLHSEWRPRPTDVKHLYIHIPFCHRRCAYCDFNTYANMDDRMEAYVDALCSELANIRQGDKETRRQGDSQDRVLSPLLPFSPSPDLTRASLRPTIFLGGGTPSMLPLPLMEQVLKAANELIPLAGAEVTVEANPGTVLGRDYLRQLRSLGVNRLSMGVQSLHDPTLRVLGRIHTAAEARASYEDARRAGFENINLDFIFGLPGQTIEQWDATLREIGDWQTDHFSLYSLILEATTPLYAQVVGGRLSVPDEDATADMYERAIELLGAAGYEQYEISNWAIIDKETGRLGDMRTAADDNWLPVSKSPCLPIPRRACHHNLAYWLNADYLACGAGAHGHQFPQRYSDVLGIDDYISRVQSGRSPIAETIALSERDLAAETMFMGLRLNVGVSYAHFRDRCGAELEHVYGNLLTDLVGLDLLERDERGVRLTEHGRMLGNQVFARFV